MTTRTNLFADIKHRFDYALKDDEQRYQLELHSSRRLANQAAGYFVRAKENSIFRGEPMEAFDKEAAWRFADKWFFGAYLGQIARSMTLGYSQHQDWQTLQQAAELLTLLADTAASHDPSGAYAQQLQASAASPMHQLTRNGYEQSRLLQQFGSGEFTPTPDTALALSDYLKGLATLHSEKAALADMQQSGQSTSPQSHTNQPDTAQSHASQLNAGQAATGQADTGQPNTGQLATPRPAPVDNPLTTIQKQAFRAAGLFNHAAVPISSEDYIKQDKTYLTPAEALPLAKDILATAQRLGIQVVRESDTHGNGSARPIALLRNGQPLDATTTQQLYQESMANFARHPQAHSALEAFGADGVAEDTLRQNTARHGQNLPPARLVNWEKSTAPRSFAERALHQVKSAKTYLSRPQIIHETWKIYNRAVSNQLLALPVNLFEETLRYGVSSLFNKDAQKRLGNRDVSGAKALLGLLTGRFNEGMSQADKDFIGRNVKANMFRFFVQPIASGHGETFLKEGGYAFTKGASVLANDQARDALDQTLDDALKHLPQLGKRLNDLQRAHPAELVLQEPQFAHIPALLEKPEATTTPEEHHQLAQFYERLSEANLAYAEEALAPLTSSPSGQGIEPMAAHFSRALSKPVQTPAEAAIALAFARSVLEICREHHAMIEYVSPDKRLLDPKKTEKLAHFIEKQAENYQKTGKNPRDLIAFADNVAAHLSASLDPQATERLLNGRYKERLSQAVEKQLFTPRSAQDSAANIATKYSANTSTKAETTPWSGRAKRDKPNRLGVVRERLGSAELKKEIDRLNGRLQGEKWTGTASTLVQAKLRHKNSLFDAGNLAYTAWTVVAYPIIYSKGLVAVRETWDELLSGKQTAVKEAQLAMEHLDTALDKALELSPETGKRFAESTGVIPTLTRLQNSAEFDDISRICLKPASERNPTEIEHIRDFFARTGDRIVEESRQQFAAITGHRPQPDTSLEQAITERLATPATSLDEAITSLGFVQSILAHNSGRINVLAYLDPSERELKHGHIREVAGFINDQAQLSGLADGKASEQDIIRFANVASNALAAALEKSLDKQPDFTRRLASKYAEKTAETISQRL